MNELTSNKFIQLNQLFTSFEVCMNLLLGPVITSVALGFIFLFFRSDARNDTLSVAVVVLLLL